MPTAVLQDIAPDLRISAFYHYAFSGARDDKEKFDSMRLARFDRDEGFAATQRLYASLGSEAIIPLCSTEYVSFMMQFSWRELNAGRIKSIFKDAFPAQYGALGLTRTCLRKAQQLEAGTLNLYEQFLPGSVLDRNKTGNVRRILNDLFRASTMELNVLQAQVGYTNYE